MATTPTPASKLTAASVAADITRYGGTAIAVLEVVENAMPGLSVPAGAQAIVAAVVAVVTGLMSVFKAKATDSAVKAALAAK